MENDVGGPRLLSLEEVAERLRRSARFVLGLCEQRRLGYVLGTPITIREDQLWLYLIGTRNVRPEAFGPAPRSEGAENALSAARAQVIADRLADIELEDVRRARMSAAARERETVPRTKARRR